MLGEIFLLGYVGFEIARRPGLRKKALKIAKKLPGASMYVFEKAVSTTSTYLINAWPDMKKLAKGGKKC